jgi:Fe2+ or Zn2+ uptake regulation protein
MNHYHDTGTAGSKVKDYEGKAAKQDEAVLTILKLYYPESLSPTEVHAIYIQTGRNCPLTSIRRALTNLTKESLAVKTDVMKDGSYDRLEHTWKYYVPAGPVVQMRLF